MLDVGSDDAVLDQIGDESVEDGVLGEVVGVVRQASRSASSAKQYAFHDTENRRSSQS